MIKIKSADQMWIRAFCDAIKCHLQNTGKAELSTNTKTVIIRDIVQLTSEDEVVNVVQIALNIETKISVNISTRDENRGMTEFINFPEAQTNALVRMGKIQKFNG